MWSSLKQKNRLVRPLYLQCSFGNFFLPSSSFRLCHSLFPFFNSALTLFSALNWFLHNLCQLARFSQSNIDLWKPLANGRKALLANNSQHCWKLHVVSVCTPCCMLLCVVGRLLSKVWNRSNFKSYSNRCNIVGRHLPILLSVVASVCT